MTVNHNMYIDPGYFADGYLHSPCPVSFSYGATRIDLRAPSALSGTVRMLQPEEYSTGWQRIGYAPRVVMHTLTLQYQRLSLEERNALDGYFDTVDFSAVQSFGDVNEGVAYPVWFDQPEISFEESSYRNFRASFTLWGYQAFHPAPSVPATISALLGAASHPEGVTRTKKQPRLFLSDGSVVVYNKSAITRRTTRRNLARIPRDDLGSLIAHFVRRGGTRDTWAWDSATCRYAASELSWQRSSSNSGRYDVQVSVEEELA